MSRILVACECSGSVRDAFSARGHDAWSCDLLPSETPGNHLQCDVREILGRGWDMMIAHPPCDYLTVSGNRWFSDTAKAAPNVLTGEARRQAQIAAFAFVLLLWNEPIPRVVIENPIGRLSTLWRKPSQVIQPWMFGAGECKATCLWIRGLPLLSPTHRKDDLFCAQEPQERVQRLANLPPGPTRKKERARTFAGIARAMSEQWGSKTGS